MGAVKWGEGGVVLDYFVTIFCSVAGRFERGVLCMKKIPVKQREERAERREKRDENKAKVKQKKQDKKSTPPAPGAPAPAAAPAPAPAAAPPPAPKPLFEPSPPPPPPTAAKESPKPQWLKDEENGVQGHVFDYVRSPPFTRSPPKILSPKPKTVNPKLVRDHVFDQLCKISSQLHHHHEFSSL